MPSPSAAPTPPHHVYVGNIHDLENDSTYCASCGQVLIERDWYELERYNLGERGCCKFCDARLPGRFKAKPGKWGRQRLPVNMERRTLGKSGLYVPVVVGAVVQTVESLGVLR